jgi:hypothetical protein
MNRLVLVTLLLATLVGCAGSLKYERAKRTRYVPCIEMKDTLLITPEVDRGKSLLKLCGSNRR